MLKTKIGLSLCGKLSPRDIPANLQYGDTVCWTSLMFRCLIQWSKAPNSILNLLTVLQRKCEKRLRIKRFLSNVFVMQRILTVKRFLIMIGLFLRIRSPKSTIKMLSMNFTVTHRSVLLTKVLSGPEPRVLLWHIRLSKLFQLNMKTVG